MRIKTWHVELFIDEDGDCTAARAILHTGEASHVEGRGTTRRAPEDADVPEIGDEVAVALALHELADNLLGIAAGDIAAIERAPVRLAFTGPGELRVAVTGPPRPRSPRQHRAVLRP